MRFIAYSMATFLAASSSFAASPACSYKAGDQVTFTKPADYVSVAQANQGAAGEEKGEFETTEDYQKRLEAAKTALGIKPMLLEYPANHDREDSGVTYLADEQQFRVFLGAWSGSLYGINYRYMDKVILSETPISVDSYMASNSYGNQIEVMRKVSDVIAIKSWDTFPKDIGWKLPKTKDGEEGDAIYVPVPIEKAKAFKSRLVTGVEFLPKPPFFSTDDYHVQPTLETPLDITYRYEQFDGVVLCAVLADTDGKVIATVEPIIR